MKTQNSAHISIEQTPKIRKMNDFSEIIYIGYFEEQKRTAIAK